jgi:hypothetical protein
MTHQGLTTDYYGIEAELFTIERASAATTGLP